MFQPVLVPKRFMTRQLLANIKKHASIAHDSSDHTAAAASIATAQYKAKLRFKVNGYSCGSFVDKS